MPGIKIDSIEIYPSLASRGGLTSTLHIVSGDYDYKGNFEHNNLMHFAQAVSEAIKYFGAAYGHISVDSEGTVRKVER